MLKQFLVAGLLALTTFSVSLAANPEFPEQPADTIDLKSVDTTAAPTLDPRQRLHEIPVNDGWNATIELEHLNPAAIAFVRDYESKSGSFLEKIRIQVAPQLQLVAGILEQYDLPAELQYLAIVESQLHTRARSRVGAVGPWQFMPATARNMGLKVNKYVDERRDLGKSTHAAARYLKSLFSMYEDWLLVLAAYNAGPGNVNVAIRKAGSRDFWTLERFLPAESRGHVKKFIATHFIMAGAGSITVLTKDETEKWNAAQPVVTNGIEADWDPNLPTLARRINGRYHSSVISRLLLMNQTEFLLLNPGFDRQIANYGEYELKLPADKMELFVARKPEIMSESMQLLLQAATADRPAN